MSDDCEMDVDVLITDVVESTKEFVTSSLKKLKDNEVLHTHIVLSLEKLKKTILGNSNSIWLDVFKEVVEMLLHEI